MAIALAPGPQRAGSGRLTRAALLLAGAAAIAACGDDEKKGSDAGVVDDSGGAVAAYGAPYVPPDGSAEQDDGSDGNSKLDGGKDVGGHAQLYGQPP